MYPKDSQDAALLGDECAGVVTAVGDEVDDFSVGDAVIGYGAGSLASHVTLPAVTAMHKVSDLPFQAAVTMPVAFLTAWYALQQLGRIRQDKSVLIHSATGGVGLAALQVAWNAGAKIFVTAGNQEKRDFLKLFGIEGAMDSRGLSFADQVQVATEGRGVDLLLNSLSGRAIAKGLASLAHYGQFLEIGKRDIYQDNFIGLWPFHKNITFSAIDLGEAYRRLGTEFQGTREGILRIAKPRECFSPYPTECSLPRGSVKGSGT